jgi:hypothetical protein
LPREQERLDVTAAIKHFGKGYAAAVHAEDHSHRGAAETRDKGATCRQARSGAGARANPAARGARSGQRRHRAAGRAARKIVPAIQWRAGFSGFNSLASRSAMAVAIKQRYTFFAEASGPG